MGKKIKTGKNRLDKYYHLAKEQGYRARSAFKLIQIAQRNDIFSNCRVLLDLCAAPGGWLQVAQKNMPVASHIVGVDLAPIKPIHGVVTIQSDITTQRCRSLLKSQFEGRDVDVVLHDGAPNVGTSWALDAYVQNELVLHATKLASEFLRAGGIYITKVFRSRDYLSLLWVFQQLFSRVIATKPSSSRNISAEIFIICLGYKKPDKLDPRFFDHRHIFLNAEDRDTNAQESLDKKQGRSLSELMKAVSKKNREGYNEGDDYRETSVTSFLYTNRSPAEFLISHHKLLFPEDDVESQKILSSPLTTQEIIQCCEDLKVIGKREFALLIKWRKRILKEIACPSRPESMEVEEEIDEQSTATSCDWDEKLKQLTAEEGKMSLKEDRKRREYLKKMKLKREMSLGAFNPVVQDEELFQLRMGRVLEDDAKDVDEETYWKKLEGDDTSHEGLPPPSEQVARDVEDGYFIDEAQRLAEMEEGLNVWANETKARKKEKEAKQQLKRKKETRRQLAYAAWNRELAEIAEKGNRDLAKVKYSDDDEDEVDEVTSFHIQDSDADIPEYGSVEMRSPIEDHNSDVLSKTDCVAQLKSARWFDQPLFKEAGVTIDTLQKNDRRVRDALSQSDSGATNEDHIVELSDSELVPMPLTEKQKRKEKRKRALEKESHSKLVTTNASARGRSGGEKDELLSVSALSSVNKSNPNTFTVVSRNPLQSVPIDTFDVEGNVSDIAESEKANATEIKSLRNPKDLLQIQALGCMLARKRTRLDLIDGAYNRYAFDNDEDMPQWFLEDEEERMRPQLPVSKEMMREYRQKLEEIKRRPIRKVLEAQSRKKDRLKKRFQKAKKQAQTIAESADYTEVSKASSINKLMKKAMRESKTGTKYIASRRTGGTTSVGRNKGETAGKVRVVDRRLKKDKRAQNKRRKSKRSRR